MTRSLLRIPVNILPFVKKNDMGDVEFGSPLPATCYVDETSEIVLDREGKEVLSKIAFYIGPYTYNPKANLIIKDSDNIQFPGETYQYRIKSLRPIRDINGKVVLWVVHA